MPSAIYQYDDIDTAVAGLMNTRGQNVGRKPSSANFLVWWDGDPGRELLDGNRVDKYGTAGDTRLLTADGAASIVEASAAGRR